MLLNRFGLVFRCCRSVCTKTGRRLCGCVARSVDLPYPCALLLCGASTLAFFFLFFGALCPWSFPAGSVWSVLVWVVACLKPPTFGLGPPPPYFMVSPVSSLARVVWGGFYCLSSSAPRGVMLLGLCLPREVCASFAPSSPGGVVPPPNSSFALGKLALEKKWYT